MFSKQKSGTETHYLSGDFLFRRLTPFFASTKMLGTVLPKKVGDQAPYLDGFDRNAFFDPRRKTPFVLPMNKWTEKGGCVVVFLDMGSLIKSMYGCFCLQFFHM